MTYSNNLERIVTATAEFMIEQRNFGFAVNDGRWILSQLPELFWYCGCLRRRRAGRFLGVFADLPAVQAAIAEAAPMPLIDEAVESIGRVSC